VAASDSVGVNSYSSTCYKVAHIQPVVQPSVALYVLATPPVLDCGSARYYKLVNKIRLHKT